MLDTLAASYAEAGRYPDAILTAEKALSIGGESWEQAAEVKDRLALYRSSRPFHVQ